MNVRLMYRDRESPPLQEISRYERRRDFGAWPPPVPPHEQALTKDLELNTLLRAMAGEDAFILDVARRSLLSGVENDINAILYRQEVLKDCLKNPAIVRELYNIVVETFERQKKRWLILSSKHPVGVLREAIDMVELFVETLKKLKGMADAHAGRFHSEGITALLTMFQEEFSDEYFARIQHHLKELKFRGGVLLSAELGEANESTRYVLRRPRHQKVGWLRRLFGKRPAAYAFSIDPRDEGGARILSDMRERGINLVANALAQSADHILAFLQVLRTELAFYVACLNLREKLATMGTPICFPKPHEAGTRKNQFVGLRDVSLALTMGRDAVGNDLAADGKSLVIITGANQGGKSTFLRSIGLAQMMMQCGMFVAAESFTAEICSGLYTHYKREEDATMKSGKLDEELGRMSAIADVIAPNSMILFNESFASTNEREGSEIARQIVTALLEKRIKVCFVTHLYDFAHSLHDRKTEDAVFLRAERRDDGTRTFRCVEGEPLETSYGEDLYSQIFAAETEELGAG